MEKHKGKGEMSPDELTFRQVPRKCACRLPRFGDGPRVGDSELVTSMHMRGGSELVAVPLDASSARIHTHTHTLAFTHTPRRAFTAAPRGRVRAHPRGEALAICRGEREQGGLLHADGRVRRLACQHAGQAAEDQPTLGLPAPSAPCRACVRLTAHRPVSWQVGMLLLGVVGHCYAQRADIYRAAPHEVRGTSRPN